MTDEFRIQHLASVIQKSLKTSIKPDVIAKEFSDNKTPFVTAQVNTHNSKKIIAEKCSKPREFLAMYDELKSQNVRILNGLTYIMEKIVSSPTLPPFINAQAEYLGNSRKMKISLPLEMSQTPIMEVLGSVESTGTTNVDEFSNMLNKSIEEGKRKMKSDSIHLTLSKDTMLSVETQEMTAKYNKINAGPTLRQPDWWNCEDEITSITRNITGKLEALPESSQEVLIVDDLMSLILGGKAAYFTAHVDQTEKHVMLHFSKYSIDEKCDRSLKSLTIDPLRLVHCVDVIRRFVKHRSDFHYGYLSHALAAELENFIQEVNLQIINFETRQKENNFKKSLQQLTTYIRPILNQAKLISDLCTELFKSNARGAVILSILHEKALNSAGDIGGQNILYLLTKETSKPYLNMITAWIQQGILIDDHSEFMITAREELGKEKLQNVYNDSYWEQHYSIVRERIPRFLEPFAEKILNTGKYLNVIRECGIKLQPSQTEQVAYHMGPNCVRLFEAPIDKCYKFAAKVLVDLLMKEHNLISRLKSVKRFFLLDQGDFLNQFIDLADDELKMPVSDITSSRLEALLEISIRTSAADKDPYKDDLKVVLSDKDLITQLMSVISIESSEEETLKRLNPKDLDLSGLEALSFDYVVKWPLSLIISRKKIVHYQLLFRFLFYTKHIERIVNNVWLTSTQLTKQYGCHTLYYKAAILRNKMLNFVLNLQTYVTNEVIEPNWHTLMTTLKNVQNIDEVLNAHDQFLETCLRECHLSNKAIFKLIHKLMAKVTIYVNFMNGVHRQMELRSANSMSIEMKMEYLATIFTPQFDAQINTMDRDFNKEILHLVDMLREVSKRQKSDSVLNLVLKLDFNHYLTKMAAAEA